MNKMKVLKIISLSFLVILINAFCSFSYVLSEWSTYQGTSSTGYESFTDQVKYNQFFNLNNVKVKFTQNDTNYVFKITAEAYESNVQGKISEGLAPGYIHYTVHPFLYKTKDFGNSLIINESTKMGYADYNSGETYYRGSISIGGNNISNVNRTYASNGTLKTDTHSGNGDKFFSPLSARPYEISIYSSYYKYTNTYPNVQCHDSSGVSIVSNSSLATFDSQVVSSKSRMTTLKFSINTTISINKNYIDHYQYVCFGSPYVIEKTSSIGSTNWGVTGYSICTNTINLKDYAECEHDWKYIHTGSGSMEHTIKCSKCEWEKKEKHDFIYEYDGLIDNMCICGLNKQVNHTYELNSDSYGTLYDTVSSGVIYASFSNLTKKGYVFKNYKKYVKELVGTCSVIKTQLKETYIAEVDIMDTYSGNLSTKYVAEYDPIKYNITFHDENNKNLDIKIIDSEIKNALYGKEYDVPRINVKGYTLKGFTTIKGSDRVDFDAKVKLKNLTEIDGTTIDLYPVFEKTYYKIYCEYRQRTATMSTILNVTYGERIEFPDVKILPLSAKGYGWHYGDVIVKNSLDLDKYISDDNQIIKIYFKIDDGASVYIDGETNFVYQIKYVYPHDEVGLSSTKNYTPSYYRIKFGDNADLLNIERLKISSGSSGNGWYFKGKKINNTSDIDPYITYNDEVVEVVYRYFRTAGTNAPSHDGGKSSEIDGGNAPDKKNLPDNQVVNVTTVVNTNESETNSSIELYPLKKETIEIEKEIVDKETVEKEIIDGEAASIEETEREPEEELEAETEESEPEESETTEDDLLYGPRYIDDEKILKYLKGTHGPFLHEMYQTKKAVVDEENILKSNRYNLLSANMSDLIDFFINNKVVAYIAISFLLILLIIYEYFTIKYFSSGKEE